MGIFHTILLKPTSQIPRNGLVAEYLFNNNYLDTSGNGLNGINDGTVLITDKKGNPLSAIDYISGADKVDIGDDDLLSFGNGVDDSPFSISIWINVDDGIGAIIAKSRAVRDGEYYMFISSSQIFCRCVDESASSFIGKTTPVITLSTWIHVVWTYDGSGLESGMKIYLDSVQSDLTGSSGAYTAMENTTDALFLGEREGGSNLNFDGKQDNIRIYSRELSQGDVDVLFDELN